MICKSGGVRAFSQMILVYQQEIILLTSADLLRKLSEAMATVEASVMMASRAQQGWETMHGESKRWCFASLLAATAAGLHLLALISLDTAVACFAKLRSCKTLLNECSRVCANLGKGWTVRPRPQPFSTALATLSGCSPKRGMPTIGIP